MPISQDQIVEMGKASIQDQRGYDFLGGAKVLAAGLPRVPVHMVGKAIETVQGQAGADVVNPDFFERISQGVRKWESDKQAEIGEKYKDRKFLPGIKVSDVGSLPENLAYSVNSAGAGIGAGMASSAATGGNPVAGYTAGMAAAGEVAYRGTTYDFMREVLTEFDNNLKTERGSGLTEEEQTVVKNQFEKEATETGLWEALPEAIGGGIGFKILTSPLKGIMTKILGEKLGEKATTNILAKIAGSQIEELSTETITQMGQTDVRGRAGLEGGKKVDWTKAGDWIEALKEVAPQTVLLSAVMGGAIAGGNRVHDNRKIRALDKSIKDDEYKKIPNDEFGNEVLARTLDYATELQKTRPKEQRVQNAVQKLTDEIAFRKQSPDAAIAPEEPKAVFVAEVGRKLATDEISISDIQELKKDPNVQGLGVDDDLNKIIISKKGEALAPKPEEEPAQAVETQAQAVEPEQSALPVTPEEVQAQEPEANGMLQMESEDIGGLVQWADRFNSGLDQKSQRQLSSVIDGAKKGNPEDIETLWKNFEFTTNSETGVSPPVPEDIKSLTISTNGTNIESSGDETFVRSPSKAENVGGKARQTGFNKIPDAPEGFEKVYKPYGAQGAGYYYARIAESSVNDISTNTPEIVNAESVGQGEVPTDKETLTVEKPQDELVQKIDSAISLPTGLSGAKPRYSYGNKQFDLTFKNDIDKAAYIAAQEKPSKKDAEYLKFVAEKTGLSEDEIRDHGRSVKQTIKDIAAKSNDIEIIVPGHPIVKKTEAAPSTPKLTTKELTPVDKSEKEPHGKREKAMAEYNAFIASIPQHLKDKVGDVIKENPISPSSQKLRVARALAKATTGAQAETSVSAAEAPAVPKPVEKKAETSEPVTRESFQKSLERKGTAIGPNGQTYSIQEQGEGNYYVRTVKDGIRFENGGGYPAKWSMEYARQKAVDEAFGIEYEFTSLETGKKTTETIPDIPSGKAPIEKAVEPAVEPEPTAAAEPKAKPTYGEGNKVFTKEAADAARELLRKKLSRVSTGLDPELVQAGIQLAGYHIEAGARSFVNYAKAMLEDLGAAAKPYLRSWYEAVRYYPGFENKDMTEAADIEKVDIDDITDYNNKETAVNKGGQDEQIRPINERLPEREGSQEGQGDVQRPIESALPSQGRTGDKTERKPDKRRVDGSRSRGNGESGPSDYSITNADSLGKGGPKQKFKDNLAAIRLLKQIGDHGDSLGYDQARPEEQSILVKYVGWGGLQQAFRRPDGSIAKGWESEVAELEDLLSEKEYAAAIKSTRNAHYTNQPIIKAVYSALGRLGFTHGKILEPAVGTGNFIGLMPKKTRSKSRITGIELEPLTASISKQLYPNQNIVQSGFQNVTLAPNSYDLAIGNPPFGDEKLFDPENKDLKNFSIHNYFFAKSLKAIRPNGLLAMVVSSSMMDKISDSQRSWINDRAEFLGAIRLPNNAFRGSAGTDVTTDIVFLRKLEEGETSKGEAWLNLKRVKGNGNDWRINEYFANHPDMMLGALAPNKLFPAEIVDGVYDAVPGMTAIEGIDFEKALAEAVQRLPEKVYKAGKTFEEVQKAKILVSDPGFAMPFGYTLDNKGQATRRLPDVNGERQYEMVEYAGAPISGTRLERFKGLLGLRDDVRRLIRAEIADDSSMDSLRAKLNKDYDAFIKEFGFISQTVNASVLQDDPSDLPLLRSLESNFDKGISRAVARSTGQAHREPSAKKSAIFTVRTREPYREVTKADNAKDGLFIVLRENGFVDIDRIASLTGKTVEEVSRELEGDIFQNPETESWETAEYYLAGNVKQKLKDAQAAAQKEP
ncbi:MAG: hypothetical protein KKA41_04525, partial [Proteobacteria bacterium]|nr:hypothetical protein [Pseudomonadota bacterium]